MPIYGITYTVSAIQTTRCELQGVCGALFDNSWSCKLNTLSCYSCAPDLPNAHFFLEVLDDGTVLCHMEVHRQNVSHQLRTRGKTQQGRTDEGRGRETGG